MNLQYLSDKAGHTTAVQLQIPIEEWNQLKKKYKEFEEEENANSLSVPDWHLDLVKKEISDVENGTSDLADWTEVRKKINI